jgi:hypothetical protein
MHAALLALLVVGGAHRPKLASDRQPAVVARAVVPGERDLEAQRQPRGSCPSCSRPASGRSGAVGSGYWAPQSGCRCVPGPWMYGCSPPTAAYYYRPYDYRRAFDYPWDVRPRTPICAASR